MRAVLKFGGTSMGSAESIGKNVVPIVVDSFAKGEKPIVVVSAMSGVTNQLLKAAGAASKGEFEETVRILGDLQQKHCKTVETLIRDRKQLDECTRFIEGEIESLRRFLQAISVIRELSYRSNDAIMAVGEKLSAGLFACVLRDRGQQGEYVNLEEVIPPSLQYIDDSYWDKAADLVAERFAEVDASAIPVATGFFGTIDRGMIESVGRGYSDYCASLIGAAVGAKEIQIWTDVDGVLSTNPSLVPDAHTLPSVSYDEMAELSRFGAKVLHPFSVRPAMLKGVPIRILNTFNRAAEGTFVTTQCEITSASFKSIAYKKNISVVHLATPRMLMAHGFFEKVTACFSRHEIQIDLAATSEVSISLTIDEPAADVQLLVHDLDRLGKVEVIGGQSIICLVGMELKSKEGVQGRIFSTLNKANVPVRLISQGASLVNVSLVVDDADCERAVKLLHQEFFG